MMPKQRLLASFQGRDVDRIPWSPFLAYFWDYMPQDVQDKGELSFLEEIGADPLLRGSHQLFSIKRNRCSVHESVKGNEKLVEYETPVGKLYGRYVYSSAGNTWFLMEHFVKTEEDFKTLTYLNEDALLANALYDALGLDAREFQPIPGGDYQLKIRFESNPDEKIFGMGQYQHPYLDLKSCILELAQRNSQVSVPFAISNLGYGFLWNNPAIGQVTFGKNATEWVARSTKQLDYWITAGDTPAEIEEAYAGVTGTVPMMPDYGMGFWQCKLRYRTQDELLDIAREYKRRGLPISVIVIDFFHWPKQGEWKFDPAYWPDPDMMVRELEEMGIKLMVSVWPTVDKECENYSEMLQNGYLVRTDRGVDTRWETLKHFRDAWLEYQNISY
jgi:alpha-glucosidase (family GH31 glycosyl hydrolase)